MSTGIIGKKIGMTQVYADDGRVTAVTAIEAGPCLILAVRDKKLQLGFEAQDAKRLKKPQAGYFKKNNLACQKLVREFRRDPAVEYKAGDTLKADLFQAGDFVDVTGISIGKGFQGGMKRWNWSGAPQTHGSMSHRRVGSLGSSTTPGRVWKGHHLPGHMGAVRVTVQNLLVVKSDAERNILLVKGAVPGHRNGYLLVNRAKKRKPLQKKEAPAQAKAGAKPAAKPAAKKK